MNYTSNDIFSNPVANSTNYSTTGMLGGDAGVQLSVGGGIPTNGYVPVAQMNSAREDLLYGTFRALMKITPVPGTCSAFFWVRPNDTCPISIVLAPHAISMEAKLTELKYFSNSQEIDFEILSSQFNFENGTFPINLILQSEQSAQQGFVNVGSPNWKVVNLPFDPTSAFHEYRIDFVPGNVIFYADEKALAKISTTAVPTSPGHLILNNWSNGDPTWSAGPPAQKAVTTVAYVKAYFNSSDPARQEAANLRCTDPSSQGSKCPIDDQSIAPNSGSLFTSLFSNLPNSTNNQTIYGKNGATSARWHFSTALLNMLVISSIMVGALF